MSVGTDVGMSVIVAIVWLYTVITWPFYWLAAVASSNGRNPNGWKARVVSRSPNEVTFRALASDERCSVVEELREAEVTTMANFFSHVVKKFGSRRALGTRTLIKEYEQKCPTSGKMLSKVAQGDYRWITYNEVDAHSDAFGRGLRELCNVKPRDKVCIIAETKAEWLISAIGCYKNAIGLVTVYANLGEEGLVHGIVQTEATAIIVSHELLDKMLGIIAAGHLPNVRHVVYFEHQLRGSSEKSPVDTIELLPFSQVITTGQRSSLSNARPQPQDTAIVMYTSGSTGTPKGVVISHANLISAMMSLAPIAHRGITDDHAINEDDAYLAFLPLAHVLEMLAEHLMLLMGIKLGYSGANTLTDKSTKVGAGDRGDAVMLRPTIMAAVPLVLDRIYKGINNNVAAEGPFKQKLFRYFVEYRIKWTKRGFHTPIANAIIFSKIKALVGGNLRLMLSGGAPLSDDAHEFIRACFNVKLLQGYGLTETCATACITDPDDMTTGIVGPPLPGVDVRIVNWEEGSYTVKDTVGPRGEIVIGGHHVSSGYYNNEEATEEGFFQEDDKMFFRTGDIGWVQRDGSVKIIDRKKDLVKLQAGEYISLGKIEACLKSCPLVENMCVYGDSHMTNCVAIVVPEQNKLRELARAMGKGDQSIYELCHDPAVVSEVQSAIAKQAIAAKLIRTEIPQRICLVPDEWTPESGLVTAAFKLKRKAIEKKYQNLIDEMHVHMKNKGAVLINLERPKRSQVTHMA